MRLGLNFGQDFLAQPANLKLAQEADRMGYSVCWAAEAYGSDAATVLGWLAAHTKNIDIGSAIFQIPGRTPALMAMTAATLDTLSGGRFRLGLGVSGPQVSEGWHGVKFDRPLERTREYIEIVNRALLRERVKFEGKHYQLPLPGGPGVPLKMIIHPPRPHIPTYLAATGPKNIELSGEIADGWLALFFSADQGQDAIGQIIAGRQKVGKGLEGFDVVATVPIVLGADAEESAGYVRGYSALYVGGMGSRQKNFYNTLARDMGFEQEAALVQDLYLEGKKAEAEAAVPLGFIEKTSLVGSVDRMADSMQAFAEAGVTTLALKIMRDDLPIEAQVETLHAAVYALAKSGTAD